MSKVSFLLTCQSVKFKRYKAIVKVKEYGNIFEISFQLHVLTSIKARFLLGIENLLQTCEMRMEMAQIWPGLGLV